MKMTAVLLLLASALLTGCAQNEYGVPIYKRPDSANMKPGTPWSKVKGVGQAKKRAVLPDGKYEGAETWVFEWDLPGDDVNNSMFTTVAVKDGVIVAVDEQTANKWQKDPKLYQAAKLDTQKENEFMRENPFLRWRVAWRRLTGQTTIW